MRKEKGITLIALIITIIVLLILAGVALRTVTGYESIPDQASKAVDKYKDGEAVAQEQAIIDEVDALLKKYLGIEELTPLEGPASVDVNGLATKDTLIKPDANSNVQIVIPAGWAPAKLTGSGGVNSNPGQNGTVSGILPADQWIDITADQINKGIVIVNGPSDFEEYVWVPIPDSSSFVRKAWRVTGITPEFADTSTENKFWEDKTTTEYKNMVSSVNTNKGFYIGRYEASEKSSTVAQSKRRKKVWEITQTNAITYSANSSIANSHLMYGIEWDSVLNWFVGKATISSSTAGTTKTMELADVQDNGSSWGNYVGNSRGCSYR